MSNSKTRTLSIARTPNHPLRLEPSEAVHVGVDVHKATYSVALYSDGRGVLTTWVQPARPEVLIERLSPIREAVAQIVYEAGPTGFGLARRLRAEGYTAQIIAPSKLLTPSARRPRATAWTAAGWPSSRPRACSTRSGSRPSWRRPTVRCCGCVSS
jgi:hypothetical protein